MTRTTLLLLGLALAGLARGQDVAPVSSLEGSVVERYYEIQRGGQKLGYSKVTWAPSTFQGQPSLRDQTTVVRRQTRNMSGYKTVFETRVEIELERGYDGTLWWQKSVSQEGARQSVEELTWDGHGYTHVSQVVGQPAQTVRVELAEPVSTDAESFVGPLLRAGSLRAGDTASLRLLDVAARGTREHVLTIGEPETVEGEAGPLQATPVLERDPASGAQTTLWLDDQGAFVKLRVEGGTTYRRVTRQQAEDMPVRAAEYTITSPATPQLERLFTADKTEVLLYLQPDPEREQPEFPDSPWSKVVSVRGQPETGQVYALELTKYDAPEEACASLPVDRERFARELEPTVLLCCDHPELVATAKQVIGDETNLKRAAYKLARFVYSSLAKRSPDVGQTTALTILRDREGDCSEHAVLFVALCRAAGIPARRCSGYVCLGSIWGAHAWAEIWVGQWIAADPTTGEVGGGARYLFFGYQDVPGKGPGVVSARAQGRMRLVTTAIEEHGRRYDLRLRENYTLSDPEAGVHENVLTGVRLEGVPKEWEVTFSGSSLGLRAEGFQASVSAYADQGAELQAWGGVSEYAGLPASLSRTGNRVRAMLHLDRKMIRVAASGPPEVLKQFEEILRRSWAPAQEEAPAEEPAPEAPPR
ncbi:MAG: transglutaminase-like domain-containing protein [Planctomycetota bacterium]